MNKSSKRWYTPKELCEMFNCGLLPVDIGRLKKYGILIAKYYSSRQYEICIDSFMFYLKVVESTKQEKILPISEETQV